MMGGYSDGVYSPAKSHKKNQSVGVGIGANAMRYSQQSGANMKDPMNQSNGIISPYAVAAKQEEKKQHWNEIIKNKESKL